MIGRAATTYMAAITCCDGVAVSQTAANLSAGADSSGGREFAKYVDLMTKGHSLRCFNDCQEITGDPQTNGFLGGNVTSPWTGLCQVIMSILNWDSGWICAQ